MSVEKRATAGLSLNFRYDWTKRWDDYSGGRQDYFNRRNEWSLSSYNPRTGEPDLHVRLPIGPGQGPARVTRIGGGTWWTAGP